MSAAAPLARWSWTRGTVAILAFHEVTHPERFAAHLDHLAESYSVVGLGEVAAARRTEGGLPPRPVALTFDDGHRSVYEHAFPQLRARGWSATVFVVAGLVGTDEPFWWEEAARLLPAGASVPGVPRDPAAVVRLLKSLPDHRRREVLAELRDSADTAVRQPQLTWSEVAEMAEGGLAIGNHTLSHPCLTRCREQMVRRELARAHDLLAERLGEPPRTVAYPNGDVDGRVRGVVRDLGYELGLLFDHSLADVRDGDPLRTSRIRADAGASPARFRALVSGAHARAHRLRGGD